MPIKIEPSADERKRVAEALERLKLNAPTIAALKVRARRGSLQRNLNTLSTESRVARHRIEKLYPDLAQAITDERGERGQVVPLRVQLDAARRDKQVAERRLELSQTYSFRLMERIAQFRTEVRTLKDRVEELEQDQVHSDDLHIGTDDIVGIPPMPARKKKGRRNGQRS